MPKVRRSVVALAALLVLGTLGAATAGVVVAEMTGADGQTTIVSDSNSTNYLSPTADTVSGETYQTVGMDVSSAVTVAAQEIHNEHESQTFERQRQSVDEQERVAVANRQLETIKERFEQLDDQQHALFTRYADEEVSSNSLLRELIGLQVAIEAQSELLEQTETQADPSDEFRVELETIEHAITVDQPVADSVRGALVGTETPTTVYIQGGDSSLVLATVDDGQYLRQATLLDERSVGDPDQFGDDLSPGGYSQAQQRLAELYPWAYSLPNLDIGGDQLSVYSQIYQLGLTHPHGELTVYFDGATTNVFHENQYMPVTDLPRETTLENMTAAGTLSVEVTRQGGPMNVQVTDSTGEPADAAVMIDEQPVGTTGEDGSLWTVHPTDEFILTVDMPDGETITVTGPASAANR